MKLMKFSDLYNTMMVYKIGHTNISHVQM